MVWGNETKQEVKEEVKFDFSEELDSGKEIYSIYGMKGSGKTTLALSFPGTITALSFDNKTTIIKNNFYKNDERIKVFNALKYYNETDLLESSNMTYDFIIALLDNACINKPDWVMFDCAEVMTLVCEMVMRKNNNIKPFAGVTNLNVWKERKKLLNHIHKKAVQNCNKGVIYTLYVSKDEIVNEGELVMKKDVPQWTGVVLYETDFVLRTMIDYDKEKGKICSVRVCSSKNDNKLKTGEVINVTDFKNKLF